MNELLRVSELGAGYGQRGVLKGVSFSLGHGEICALLGANGSGKSTLMRALCGLIKAEGECTLGGENLWKLPQRRRAQMIGYLAQRSECALSLSSLDIVLMGYNPVLGLLERPGQAQRERALEMLGELGGAAWAEKDFGSLSEGQRQLVLFARWYAGRRFCCSTNRTALSITTTGIVCCNGSESTRAVRAREFCCAATMRILRCATPTGCSCSGKGV